MLNLGFVQLLTPFSPQASPPSQGRGTGDAQRKAVLTMLLEPLIHLSFAFFPVAPQPLLSPRGSTLRATASGELLAGAGAFSVLGEV